MTTSLDRPGGASRRRRGLATTLAGTALLAFAVVALGVASLPPAAPTSSPPPSPAPTPPAPTPTAAVTRPSPSPAPTTPVPTASNGWPGLWAQTIVVVDTSATDDATADGIRRALVDFTRALPRDHILTVIAAADTTRTAVDHVLLMDDVDLDRAVRGVQGLTFGGSRRLVQAVAAGTAAARTTGAGEYQVLLIATGTGGATAHDLRDATWGNPGSTTSDVAIRLFGVAVGTGDQEALLSRASTAYQGAPTVGDLPLALLQYRVARSGQTLLAFGRGTALGQAVTVTSPRNLDLAFDVSSPGDAVRMSIVSPSGRSFDTSAPDGTLIKNRDEAFGARVMHSGDRSTIVTFGFEPGAWTLRFSGSASALRDAWFDVQNGESPVDPLRTAYGTGDTTNDLRVGIVPMSDNPDVRHASATIIDPEGRERVVVLRPMPLDEHGDNGLNVSGPVTLGAIVPRPGPAGSYRIVISLDYAEPGGTRRAGEWLEGAYVEPYRDSDGDGITDAVEEAAGLDPHDPTDARLDPDHDGLTNVQELTRYHTDLREWDTDGGGEPDGSEVKAGRDPLDRTDDVRPRTCLDRIPRSTPTPSPSVQESVAPVPELEALLPGAILGHPTNKVSARAPKDPNFLLGFGYVLALCAGKSTEDLRVAVAVAPDLRNWSVMAIQVDGVSGRQLEEMWYYDMGGAPTGGGYTEASIDGRTYRLSSVGWATYVTDDTFYWIASLEFGDFPTETPPPIPAPREIIEDIVRQLPPG